MYAFVFPGQGSQRRAMGAPWRDTPSWSLVAQQSEVTGRDIAYLLLDAGAEELQVTSNAQLATFTLSLVILDAVQAAGVAGPGAVAGHSLGEYTALVAAEVLEATMAARLVAARGAAMQVAATASPGTMAAVLGLDPDAVAEACAGVEDAWVANDNATGQVVIAGTTAGVDAAGALARTLGAKRVIPLKVGGAFHSPLMRPAQEALDAALADAHFDDATVAVVANVDASTHTSGVECCALLSRQLTSPVRWRETQFRLVTLGVTTVVELGPGTELSGMAKRTIADVKRANVASPGDVATLVAGLAPAA